MLRKISKQKPLQATTTPPPPHSKKETEEDDCMEWKRHFWKCVLQHGVHKHTFTCKTPSARIHAFPSGMPCGLTDSSRPVQLETIEECEEEDKFFLDLDLLEHNEESCFTDNAES